MTPSPRPASPAEADPSLDLPVVAVAGPAGGDDAVGMAGLGWTQRMAAPALQGLVDTWRDAYWVFADTGALPAGQAFVPPGTTGLPMAGDQARPRPSALRFVRPPSN
jgi:hypothetical protein